MEITGVSGSLVMTKVADGLTFVTVVTQSAS
jgi:hypothetical protein